MSKTTFTISDDKKSLTIERVFQATKDRLWRAYSEKEVFEQWFAPQGWEVTSNKFEFRNGGENVYLMKCVDKNQGEWFGQVSAGKMVFNNINPKDSFEYQDYFTDEDGVVNESMPSAVSTIELVDNQDGTSTLRAVTVYPTEEGLKQVLEMGMEEGYGQTLDKLEQIISSL